MDSGIPEATWGSLEGPWPPDQSMSRGRHSKYSLRLAPGAEVGPGLASGLPGFSSGTFGTGRARALGSHLWQVW